MTESTNLNPNQEDSLNPSSNNADETPHKGDDMSTVETSNGNTNTNTEPSTFDKVVDFSKNAAVKVADYSMDALFTVAKATAYTIIGILAINFLASFGLGAIAIILTVLAALAVAWLYRDYKGKQEDSVLVTAKNAMLHTHSAVLDTFKNGTTPASQSQAV